MQPCMRYALAVLATAIALLLRWVIDPFVAESLPYQIFYLSVMLAAALGGRGPGLLAVSLGALAGTWLFAMQPDHPGVLPIEQIIRLVLYLGVGIAVSFIAGRLHAQGRRVERQRELLAVTLASIGEGVIVTRSGRPYHLSQS